MKLYIVQMSFVTVHVQQPPLSMCHGDKAINALPKAIDSPWGLPAILVQSQLIVGLQMKMVAPRTATHILP